MIQITVVSTTGLTMRAFYEVWETSWCRPCWFAVCCLSAIFLIIIIIISGSNREQLAAHAARAEEGPEAELGVLRVGGLHQTLR